MTLQGLFFHAVLPGKNETSLVEYRASNEKKKVRKANAIHRPALFFRDWFSLRADGQICGGESPDPAFMAVKALFPARWIAPTAVCEIIFLAEKPGRNIVPILRDGHLFDVVELDFTDSLFCVHEFTPGISGHFSFTLDTPSGALSLLELSAVSAAVDENISPADLSASEWTWEEEELYFSLRDALPEKELKETDLTAFFPPGRDGPAKLLNAFKFLSRKEELKLAEDLFRKEPRTGLALLRALPFEILFLMKQDVLKTVLAAMDDRMLGFFFASCDRTKRPLLEGSLPPGRKPSSGTGPVGDEQEFRQAAASLAAACLQRISGTIIPTGVSGTTVYQRKKTAGKKRPPVKPTFLSQTLVTERVFLRPLFCTDGAVYLETLESLSLLQIVTDDLSLSREEMKEVRNLKKGMILKIPCPGKGLRIKAGAVPETESETGGIRLIEQMTDILSLCARTGSLQKTKKGINFKPGSSLCAASALNDTEGVTRLVASFDPSRLRDGLPDLTDADRLILWDPETGASDILTTADAPELFSPSSPVSLPASPPVPFPLRVAILPEKPASLDTLAVYLEQAWIVQRGRNDERPEALALSLRMAFCLSAVTKDKKWAELTLLLLRRLYSALLMTPEMSLGERLDILFHIRLILANQSRFFGTESERLLGLLRPVLLSRPSLLRASLHNLFIQTCLTGHTADKKTVSRVRKGLIREKDRKTILQGLLLLSLADARLGGKTAGLLIRNSSEIILPDDAAELLSLFELSVLLGRNLVLGRP